MLYWLITHVICRRVLSNGERVLRIALRVKWGQPLIMCMFVLPGNSVLRITLQDWKGQVRSATYSTFLVADQLHKFRLTIGGFQGNVPDAMSYNNQMDFHAYDYPDAKGCATQQRAGWWYNYCTHALLNGHYYTGGAYTPGAMCDGVYWNGWYTCDYSLKYVAMTLSRN